MASQETPPLAESHLPTPSVTISAPVIQVDPPPQLTTRDELKVPSTHQTPQPVLRKRPADDLQTTADEQAKPPATSRLGVLKKASRLKKLNAPGPSPLAVEGDMDVDTESSVDSSAYSDNSSVAIGASQAPEPLGPWALGVKGVKLFFGLGANEVPPEKPSPRRSKRASVVRARKPASTSATTTKRVPSENPRKRRKKAVEIPSEESEYAPEESTVVKAEPMESEASSVSGGEGDVSGSQDEMDEDEASKLEHQGSQDTIRGAPGSVSATRAQGFRPAPASAPSPREEREKVEREQRSTSPEHIPGAFVVTRKTKTRLPNSPPTDSSQLPSARTNPPQKPTKPRVVTKAIEMVQSFRAASILPSSDSDLDSKPHEMPVAKASSSSKEKGRADVLDWGMTGLEAKAGSSSKEKGRTDVLDWGMTGLEAKEGSSSKGRGRTDVLDWDIKGLDYGGAALNSDAGGEEGEKAQLIQSFRSKSRKFMTLLKRGQM